MPVAHWALETPDPVRSQKLSSAQPGNPKGEMVNDRDLHGRPTGPKVVPNLSV